MQYITRLFALEISQKQETYNKIVLKPPIILSFLHSVSIHELLYKVILASFITSIPAEEMPTQEEINRMEAAARASKEKRENNEADREFRERKEAEERLEAAARASKERREKSESMQSLGIDLCINQSPL